MQEVCGKRRQRCAQNNGKGGGGDGRGVIEIGSKSKIPVGHLSGIGK